MLSEEAEYSYGTGIAFALGGCLGAVPEDSRTEISIGSVMAALNSL